MLLARLILGYHQVGNAVRCRTPTAQGPAAESSESGRSTEADSMVSLAAVLEADGTCSDFPASCAFTPRALHLQLLRGDGTSF